MDWAQMGSGDPNNDSEGSGSDLDSPGGHRSQNLPQRKIEIDQSRNIGELPMAPQNSDEISSKDEDTASDQKGKDDRIFNVEAETGPFPRVRNVVQKKLVHGRTATDFGYDFHEQVSVTALSFQYILTGLRMTSLCSILLSPVSPLRIWLLAAKAPEKSIVRMQVGAAIMSAKNFLLIMP
jgi:hypothetical protein